MMEYLKAFRQQGDNPATFFEHRNKFPDTIEAILRKWDKSVPLGVKESRETSASSDHAAALPENFGRAQAVLEFNLYHSDDEDACPEAAATLRHREGVSAGTGGASAPGDVWHRPTVEHRSALVQELFDDLDVIWTFQLGRPGSKAVPFVRTGLPAKNPVKLEVVAKHISMHPKLEWAHDAAYLARMRESSMYGRESSLYGLTSLPSAPEALSAQSHAPPPSTVLWKRRLASLCRCPPCSLDLLTLCRRRLCAAVCRATCRTRRHTTWGKLEMLCASTTGSLHPVCTELSPQCTAQLLLLQR